MPPSAAGLHAGIDAGTQAGFYPLNRTEFGYVALDGLVGTVNLPYLLRLNAPVPAGQVRAALRELVRCQPRLRAIVEPGRWHYRFNVRPDDELIDQLFEQAFIVEAGIDADSPAALEAYHNRLLNEPSAIEHGLVLKARYVPHATRPALFLSVPHLFGDGRSMVLWLSELVKALNGQALQPHPMESTPMWPAIVPRRWLDWPRKLAAARRHRAEEKRRFDTLRVVQLPTRSTRDYSVHAVRHHASPISSEALRAAARKLGTTTNTLVVSALAEAFLAMAPADPQAAAAIRVSVDLRPYFPEGQAPLTGNQVAAMVFFEQGRLPVAQRLQSVGAAIKGAQERFKAREMCWHYLMEEALPLLGRTLAAHVVLQLRRKGRFPRISCHATSQGNASHVNPPDAAIRIDEVHPTVASASLLVTTIEISGRLFATFGWQRCETTVEEVDRLRALFDAQLQRIVAAAG